MQRKVIYCWPLSITNGLLPNRHRIRYNPVPRSEYTYRICKERSRSLIDGFPRRLRYAFIIPHHRHIWPCIMHSGFGWRFPVQKLYGQQSMSDLPSSITEDSSDAMVRQWNAVSIWSWMRFRYACSGRECRFEDETKYEAQMYFISYNTIENANV